MIGQIYQGNRTCRSSLLKRVLWPSRIGPVKELRGFGPEPQPLGIAYVGVVLLHLAEFAGLLPVATLASERLQNRAESSAASARDVDFSIYLRVEHATNQTHHGVGLALFLEAPVVKRNLGSRLFGVRRLCVFHLLLRNGRDSSR